MRKQATSQTTCKRIQIPIIYQIQTENKHKSNNNTKQVNNISKLTNSNYPKHQTNTTNQPPNKHAMVSTNK